MLKRLGFIKGNHISVIRCPVVKQGLDLPFLMRKLGQIPIMNLLFEGGATLMGSMIREKLIDKFYIFKAPKLLYGSDGIPLAKGKGAKRMDQSIMLRSVRFRRFQDDILIEGYPDYSRMELD